MAGISGATISRILNKLQYAMANVAASLTSSTLASGDLVLVADVSADYEQKNVSVANIPIAGGHLPV